MFSRTILLFAIFASACAFAPAPLYNRATSSLNMADFTLDPSDTAFVFIEYQNEFTTEGGKLHDAVKDVMERTNSKFWILWCSYCVEFSQNSDTCWW